MTISNNLKVKEKNTSEISIVRALQKVRRNRYNAEKLFQLLEKVDELYMTNEHFKIVAIGRRDFDDAYVMEQLYQSFCEAYTIRLLEKYIDYNKRDLALLLAIFGFLPDYKKLSVKERRIAYAEKNPDVKFKNNLVSGWSDPNSRLRGIEDEIIDTVAKQLDRDTSQNEKPLGLVSSVLDELAEKFPEGLPEELPADFPKHIRIEPPSDKIPLQDEASEDIKINHTEQQPNIPTEISDERDKKLKLTEDVLEETFPNNLSKELSLECSKYVNDTVISDNLTNNGCEGSMFNDTEQTTDNDSINPSDEIGEYELETFSDDGLVSESSSDNPEDTEELSEEQFPQNSTLFFEEDIMQYAEELYNAFVDDPEDEAPPSTTFFPADKRWKRVMIPIFCLGLGGFIWTFYSIFQEGGIEAVIGNLLHGFAFGVVIMIAMIIAILALGLLAVKALDISYARKSNSKTRRSYTVQQIKDGVLGKRIVFNSISDGSYIWGYKGNEKRFVSAAKIEGENTRWRFGFIKAEDGAEYLINVFIHNDNPNGYDAIAKHCRVKIRIPGIPSKEVQVRGIISSDNARPSEYWDSVTFYNAHTPFKLVCLEPAMLYNAGIGRNGYSLGQRTEGSEGALIGYDYCDGEIPGGDGYESDILLKVKVVFDNNFIIKFRGDNCGSDGWQDTVEADIWDKVYFQIGYKNSSNAKEPQENVTISIDLPESLRYIPRSARLNIIPRPIFGNRLYDYDYDSLFLPDGLDIGDFNPKASATITFRAEVVDRVLFSGYNEALATARVSIGQVTNYDTVKIIIYKE